MNIKNKVIKLLGGFTKKEYHQGIVEENHFRLVPVYSDSLNYYIDDDSLEYEKTQLAAKIGLAMLENDLIDFSIKEKHDDFGSKIYSIRAKACVNELRG